MPVESTNVKGVQPATGSAIEYKVYARSFEPEPSSTFEPEPSSAFKLKPSSDKVLYLIATCCYAVGGYEIFFEAGAEPDTFTLMEKTPRISNQLVTYYIASWTNGERLLVATSQITIMDAHGIHKVAVVPWKILENEAFG